MKGLAAIAAKLRELADLVDDIVRPPTLQETDEMESVMTDEIRAKARRLFPDGLSHAECQAIRLREGLPLRPLDLERAIENVLNRREEECRGANREALRKVSQRPSEHPQVWIVVVPPGRTVQEVLCSSSIPKDATLFPPAWRQSFQDSVEKRLSDRSFDNPESPMLLVANEFVEAERLLSNLKGAA